MKMLVINGSSCAGKSTVVKEIMSQKDHYFHLSYDWVKWAFSKYASGKFYEEIGQILNTTADLMCKLKFNIVCDSMLFRTTRENIIEIGRKHGYEVIEVNLEADWEVLLKRFNERISNTEIRIANRSHDRFKQHYDRYHTEKNPKAVTFKTDIESPSEISGKILKMLEN